MGLLLDELVTVPFRLGDDVAAIARLMKRYAEVPMSLADACLVLMSEQHAGALVLTLDSDFRTYRRHGRGVIPTITP
jgi:predicted nucleic acid-binding protein